MPLVATHLVPADDLDVWHERAEADAIVASSRAMSAHIVEAKAALHQFLDVGPAWVGTSWGKDSTVVVRLAAEVAAERNSHIPVVWFRARPVEMPGCSDVRDAALAAVETTFGTVVDYSEVVCDIPILPTGEWGIDDGYDPLWRAYHRSQPRHILGLRSQENATRATRERFYGHSSKNGCAPITRWRDVHVFAYLHLTGMPVHPAYAMSYHGAWDRGRLRVAALGGQEGRGHGREAWERRYFGEALAMAAASVQAHAGAGGSGPGGDRPGDVGGGGGGAGGGEGNV